MSYRSLTMPLWITLGSYLLLFLSVLGFQNQNSFPAPLLAVAGIGVVLSFVASPIMVVLSARACTVKSRVITELITLFLSVGYLFIAASIVLKLWPQLMAV